MAIKDYSDDPDLNTQISGINIAEGCAPSGINNAIRQLMADVKSAQDAKDAAQAAKDAAQDAAISAAQSSADAVASETVQGRVKLSDSISSSSAASAGVAASPKAVKAAYDTAVAANIPVGSVVAFAGNPGAAPSGFLLCNGAAVSRTTYSALFSAIGTTYGAGNGSSTFAIPNLADKFIQGSGTAGTVKAAGLPNVYGWASGIFSYQFSGSGALSYSTNITSRGGTAQDNGGAGFNTLRLNASDYNTIYGASVTVQPPAVTMRYYIKY